MGKPKINPLDLRALHNAGHSQTEIGRILGVSQSAVSQMLSRLSEYKDLFDQVDMLVSGDAMYPLKYGGGSSAPAEGVLPSEIGSSDDQIAGLLDSALSVLKQAEATGDSKLILAAIKEARSTVELVMKKRGELQSGVQIAIINHPDWVNLRGKIFNTLQKYPDALEAVSKALEVTDG